VFKAAFESRGVEVVTASSGAEVLEILRTRPAVSLVTRPFPEAADSIDGLRRALRLRPATSVILVAPIGTRSGRADEYPSAVTDIVEPDVDPSRAAWVVERALAHHRLLDELVRLRDGARARAGFDQVVGRSAAMERLRARLEALARSEMGVLFLGERGSGRKHAARMLHAWSARREGPCVVVDCSASPIGEIDVEIFGAERGTRRGRERPVAGALEAVRDGTVVLENLHALPLDVQARLEGAFRTGAFERPGGHAPVPVLARVLGVSSSDEIGRALADGRLLEDLRARFPESVEIPPLRERTEDVLPLATAFVDEVRRINDLDALALAPETADALERHPWRGNVRELRDAVEHAVFVAVGGAIRPRDLPESVRGAALVPGGPPTAERPFRTTKREVVGRFERAYLSDLMERCGGNVTAGAQHAGMLRSALQRLLRKHDIRSSDFRRTGVAPGDARQRQ
jgi:DNA-binding NtrC family response regulator